jgi:hypothetical protein
MVLVAWYEQRVASPPRFDHLPELPVVSLPAVTQPTHVH